VLQLGPFGGAQSGGIVLVLWSALYIGVVLAIATAAFGRRDL
jgi:hypothetical protein